jgi:hypothetical protein
VRHAYGPIYERVVALKDQYDRTNVFRMNQKIKPSTRGDRVIGVIVTFQFGDDFDRERIEKVATDAVPRFEGMPGLRSKTFTVDASNRRAVNFYLWQSEEGARMFFNDQMVKRVTDLYGVPPRVDFVDIAALVNNGQ